MNSQSFCLRVWSTEIQSCAITSTSRIPLRAGGVLGGSVLKALDLIFNTEKKRGREGRRERGRKGRKKKGGKREGRSKGREEGIKGGMEGDREGRGK